MAFMNDFIEFLENYGIIGLAIAFVIGQAVNDLVKAVVDGAVMPVVEVFLPAGKWQESVWTIAGAEFQTGNLISASLDFLIVALLVFVFVKYALRKEEIGKI